MFLVVSAKVKSFHVHLDRKEITCDIQTYLSFLLV